MTHRMSDNEWPAQAAQGTGAQRQWLHWAALGAVLAVSLGLRLWHLDDQSIWYDEGWSIHLARLSPGQALDLIASPGHTHPPGYYLLLMGWVRLFGDSVLAVRGLSVALGVASVALLYLLGRELFGKPTGLIAAALLAVSPAHIVYSQETRMYALLMTCVTALALCYWRLGERQRAIRPADWLLLLALETLALYTHYFCLFALVPLVGWFIVRSLPEMRRGEFGTVASWAICQGAVVLAFLPWLPIALQRAGGHVAEGASSPGILALGWDTWTFLLGGHIALAGRSGLFAVFAKASLVLAVAVATGALLRSSEHRRPVFLLGLVITPLLLTFLLMQLRPGFHPRYMLMLLPPLWLLLAWGAVALLRRGWPWRALGIMALVVWLAVTGVAGHEFLRDPYYRRDDARATVAYLDGHLSPGSLVFIDNDDWALRYYLFNERLAAHFLDLTLLADDALYQVAQLLAGDRVALVKWHQGTTDKANVLPYLLELHGTLTEEQYLPGYTVRFYALDESAASPISRATRVDIGPLCLSGTTLELQTPADEGIAIALTWELQRHVAFDCKIRLDLTDHEGHIVASRDEFLGDTRGLGTSGWGTDSLVTTYHTLPVGPGLAPLDYSLSLKLYHEDDIGGLDILDEAGAPAGKNLVLATVELSPARGRTSKVIDRAALGLIALAEPPQIAPGLVLNAVAIPSEVVRNGDRLEILIEWQRTSASPLADLNPTLQLVADEQILAEQYGAPVEGRYPTSWWSQQERVLDWRALDIAPETASGQADLRLRVGDNSPIYLATVQIKAIPRLMSRPLVRHEMSEELGGLAELVGFDLSGEITSDRAVPLTLYWRALSRTDIDYVVFTHVLDGSDRLVAQHDSIPAGGQRATSGWIAGEYIVDHHEMEWLASDFAGPIEIEVGLYDPVTGQRLLSATGDSRLVLADGIMVRQKQK